MSVVFYKFKSAKDFDTCTFNGQGISVFDLKREIMVSKKLGKGTDFDLALFNAQDEKQEYSDDQTVIPRNTSVLVSRKPCAKPGKGTAQRYLTPIVQPAVAAPKRPPPVVKPAQTISNEEQDAISTMFKQQDQHWQQTQDTMATVRPVIRPNQRQQWMPELKPPPPGYICYRCGKAGHHIQNCPTMGDPAYDNKKLKKTTGIPRIFLKTVDEKEAAEKGLMVTQSGEFVVQRPADEVWQKISTASRAFKDVSEAVNNAPPDLSCKICRQLLSDAVSTPCCKTSYCDECSFV
ncbi:DWNN domain-containing protein [Gorgonomyces haynaldii]|nr:DWNN domain-containing protein [Gorgonomyces haynaldii]